MKRIAIVFAVFVNIGSAHLLLTTLMNPEDMWVNNINDLISPSLKVLVEIGYRLIGLGGYIISLWYLVQLLRLWEKKNNNMIPQNEELT